MSPLRAGVLWGKQGQGDLVDEDTCCLANARGGLSSLFVRWEFGGAPKPQEGSHGCELNGLYTAAGLCPGRQGWSLGGRHVSPHLCRVGWCIAGTRFGHPLALLKLSLVDCLLMHQPGSWCSEVMVTDGFSCSTRAFRKIRHFV